MSLHSLRIAACIVCTGVATAAPLDGSVKAGAATVTSAGPITTVTQTTARAVIDWRNFDIGAGETVRFVQPGAQSAVLNRVTGAQLSRIDGTLTANGQVYLVNPNGILVGPGGTINAASFVATTASIANDAFMKDPAGANGRYAFDQLSSVAAAGTIVNLGVITVAEGGLAALVAPAVLNSGSIVARLGTIELAASSHFTLDLFGDNLVRFAIDDRLSSALTDAQGNPVVAQVSAGGNLTADGGRIVLLSVPAASGVVDRAINLSGVVQARSVAADKKGVIELLANEGKVVIAGVADVSAPGAGVQAGSVTVIGADVRLTTSARIDASGAGGGGRIVIGGKYSAIGSTATAFTQVDAGAAIRACGTSTCAANGIGGAGEGGTVRLYSVLGTRLAGEINISGSAAKQAGSAEILSDTGLTELASAARIVAITGADQPAGFAVAIGNTLAVNPAATIDMRNVLGGLVDGSPRIISDTNPASTVRSYVRDDLIAQRQTSQSILVHAFSNNGYENTLPALFDAIANPGGTIFATGIETPVGTLRPNGGAPASLASGTADTLFAIPVTFAPARPAIPVIPSASDALTAQGSGGRDGDPGSDARPDQRKEGAILAGGPGVARSADLGRNADAYGVTLDVFGANQHVLAPSSDGNDAQVADYLCTTPYARNACH